MSTTEKWLEFVAKILADAELPHALIGGHAINTYLPPRFTADIDITVQADPEALNRMRLALGDAGFRVTTEEGPQLPSGPDFVRFAREPGEPPIEFQVAKTQFQDGVIARAVVRESGIAVATVEDLIVLKLIANRPKDLVDLAGLVRVPGVKWEQVTQTAQDWDVLDQLERLRSA